MTLQQAQPRTSAQVVAAAHHRHRTISQFNLFFFFARSGTLLHSEKMFLALLCMGLGSFLGGSTSMLAGDYLSRSGFPLSLIAAAWAKECTLLLVLAGDGYWDKKKMICS